MGEGSYSRSIEYKRPAELSQQLKATQKVLGKESEVSLTPPSENKRKIFKMPLDEIKQKFAVRYEMYLKLLRDKKRDEQTLDESALHEMRKWLTVVNSLDDYIEGHKEGKIDTLHTRQFTVFEDIRKFLETGGKEGYVKLPTGSGKTVLFAELVEALDLRTLIVVPRELLVMQTEEKLERFAPDLDLGKISGRAKQFGRQVTIITYESLLLQIESGQIKPEEVDCLILDEAHLSLSKHRMEAVKKFYKAIKLGFTATPEYSARKKVGNLLGKEIHAMSIREAVEDDGLLASFSAIIARTEVDLSSVDLDSQRREYNEAQLSRAVNVAGRNKAAVELYKKNFDGQTAIAFCVGIEHAEAVAIAFNEAGVAAVAISGKTKNKKAILDKYQSGEIKVLCNADLLTTGFDHPKASVCLNLRPTRSRVMAEQRGGRVLRLNDLDPEKYAHIIDLIDQGISDDRLPVLFADVADGTQFEPKEKRKGKGGGGVGGGRPPLFSVPGLEVVTDLEEIMKVVRRSREMNKEQSVRTIEAAVKELEEAFDKWKVSSAESKNKFTPKWLIKNGYNGLYQWSIKHTSLTSLAALCLSQELRDSFTSVFRTPESAFKELEEAFGKWKALSEKMRGKFNTNWLLKNGYAGLCHWCFDNTSLSGLVSSGTSEELKNSFEKMEKVTTRTIETAVQELEEAFKKWQDLPAAKKRKFNAKWLEDNGHRSLQMWSNQNTSLADLAVLSTNKELSGSLVVRGKEFTTPSAVVKLEEAFKKWQAITREERAEFNGSWLVKNGFFDLVHWSRKNTSLVDLVTLTTNEELRNSFNKQEKRVGRTLEDAVKELEKAFDAWKFLPSEDREPFNRKWLIDNDYGGLNQWVRKNTTLVDLVNLSANKELKDNFVDIKIKRTREVALEELEEAYGKWKSLPLEKKGKFGLGWLQGNGYRALDTWMRYNNISLTSLVITSTNIDLKNNFDVS